MGFSEDLALIQDASDHPPRLLGLRIIVWALFAILVVAVGWAYWAEIDMVTRASGSVVPSSRTQVVQSPDGGTIESIQVREGDVVEAGQVLLRFERTRFETSYLEVRARHAALLATAARLRSEILGTPPQFPAELDAYPEFIASQNRLLARRQSAFQDEISALSQLLRLVQDELGITEPLMKTGDVSRTEVLRLQRQISEYKSQITNRRNKYLQDIQAELNKINEDIAGVEQTLAQRKNQLEFTELHAPLKGTVKNVRLTTIGGVIRPGEEVLQIVPLEDDLLIQAKIMPSDIGFIKIGQDVRVKIDAFDYTIFGDIPGTLTYVSPDTLTEDLRSGETPYFRVLARTNGRHLVGKLGERLEIQPGMTATIEIRTGQRSVLRYLLKPLLRTFDQSLGEK